MRLAQVMAGAEAGGIEMFFERLTPALARSGHDTLAIIRRDPARAERLAKASAKAAAKAAPAKAVIRSKSRAKSPVARKRTAKKN
jgi:hypothetical protein